MLHRRPISMNAATSRRNLHQIPEALTCDAISALVLSFVFAIPAGFPSPAADYIEDGIDLNEYLVRHASCSFLFRVKGDSMLYAGILDGDRVVVDRSITAQHDHIIVAVVDGEYTLKRLFSRHGRVELRPDNPAYKPICLPPGTELQVWGVVVGVARRYVK